MKKVITGEMPNLVHLNDLTDNNIVGVEFVQSGIRTKIVKIKDENYVAVSLEKSVGNYSNLIEGNSIQDLYYKFSEFNQIDIFVFSSPKEIGKWLTEKL